MNSAASMLPYKNISLGVELSGGQALEQYRLVKESDRHSIPMLIVDDSNGTLRASISITTQKGQPLKQVADDIVRASQDVVLGDFFAGVEERYAQYMGEWKEDSLGEAQTHSADDTLVLGLDMPGMTPEETFLVKLPTDKPYLALAYLPFFGGYESPSYPVLTAVAKNWFETLGALPAVIKYDSIQFCFPQPLWDEQSVHKIARESFLLSPMSIWGNMDMDVQQYAKSFLYGRQTIMIHWD